VQKCGRALALRDQKLNYFETEWITCGCICTVCKEQWKDYCDFEDIEFQKRISRSVTRWLSLYRGLPRMLQLYPASNSYFMSIVKPTVVLKRFFMEILWANSVHIKTLQSFVCAFIEQVQNIEKSRASVVEVVSCFTTVKARIQERQSDVHIKPSWIKVESALRKFSEGKDHDCDLFMSDVPVLYKSCVSHLVKWTTLFSKFKCFD